MGQVKGLLSAYKNEKGDAENRFADNVISNLLYENGSMESDLRALSKKSADLKKRGAELHNLVKNKKEYQMKMSEVLSQLTCLNSFLEFVLNKMPDRANEYNIVIDENNSYLNLHKIN